MVVFYIVFYVLTISEGSFPLDEVTSSVCHISKSIGPSCKARTRTLMTRRTPCGCWRTLMKACTQISFPTSAMSQAKWWTWAHCLQETASKCKYRPPEDDSQVMVIPRACYLLCWRSRLSKKKKSLKAKPLSCNHLWCQCLPSSLASQSRWMQQTRRKLQFWSWLSALPMHFYATDNKINRSHLCLDNILVTQMTDGTRLLKHKTISQRAHRAGLLTFLFKW